MCTKAKGPGPGREGEGWREPRVFNWALGSGTCSDSIKGQIYINRCWERMTRVCNCCWAEGKGEDTVRKATRNSVHISGLQNKKSFMCSFKVRVFTTTLNYFI